MLAHERGGGKHSLREVGGTSGFYPPKSGYKIAVYCCNTPKMYLHSHSAIYIKTDCSSYKPCPPLLLMILTLLVALSALLVVTANVRSILYIYASPILLGAICAYWA